jgi:hypothetical protein
MQEVFLRVGESVRLNVMNIDGTPLYSDVILAKQEVLNLLNQGPLGIDTKAELHELYKEQL